MYVAETSDANTFLVNAGKAPIQIVRYATVEPTTNGRTVVMKPAVVLQYSALRGDQQWSYRETLLADERGRVSLAGTLLERLQREQADQIEMVQRSGSF